MNGELNRIDVAQKHNIIKMSENLDEEQKRQEEQYDFPYHYIPTNEGGTFTQTRQWSWGYRYLGGIQIVLDQLADIEFKSLIDIGCGDGRFLRELAKKYPETEMLGVDYSQRAIDFANAMNPNISYECRDIVEDELLKKYDVVTLIEVLEHIPPDNLQNFVDATVDMIRNNGKIILTVPHKNKSVQKKHYQHFNQELLTRIFENQFNRLEFIPFDELSRLLKLTQKLLGGRGSQYIITNESVKSWFWNFYRSRYLYTSEKKCGRIAMIGYR